MTGYLIKNAGSGVTIELPSGEIIPSASVVDALDYIDAQRSIAGPLLCCPGCDPVQCTCMPEVGSDRSHSD